MNPAPVIPAPRRRFWRWGLFAAGLCLTPFLLLGAVVLSYLTLNRDACTLRDQVMAATDAQWKTKVQVSVGGVTLGAVRQGLRFVESRPDIETARDALRAVKQASVGVYERAGGSPAVDRSQLFTDTDRAMQRRGWTRMVGVVDGKESVLIYGREATDDREPLELCLAVISHQELVVVATTVEARALGELVARQGRLAGHRWGALAWRH